MVVFQCITGYIVVYPQTTGYIVVFSPDNKSYHGNWLYSSMSPKTGYIVTFPPDNWLNGSMSMDNRTTGYYDLFGQFQTVNRNMGGDVKSMKGEAEPSLSYIL